MVIMDRQDYINKANNLLNQNTYRSIPRDSTNSIINKLISVLKRVKNQTGLDSNTYKSMYPIGCVPLKFYDLPKIHKPDTPLRPIVSSCGSVTYGVAKELAKILKPLLGNPHTMLTAPRTLSNRPNTSLWHLGNVSAPVMCLPCSPQSQWIQPSTSSGIYWKRTTPSKKGLLCKLVMLSSYWNFVSRIHIFLSKTSSMNRLRVQPWVPQLASLWPTSTYEYLEQKALSTAPTP